uniref:DUF5735 domain-containing protein n=1 Tax=Trichobilharzia regenti TaxID=157069 RepID=A0AA85JP50_TRIRE|nr:unnamed protein product [Trichobilharzia regenti]
MFCILNTKQLLLLVLLLYSLFSKGLKGISPDIYTEPNELAFEVYNPNDTAEKSFFLIQPAIEGSIIAHLGSYNSTHFYKMASINVFLNSHLVFVYKSYNSPLYALCSLENNYLVAHQDTIILCSFRVYIQSFDAHVFSNSSCTIRTVNESECVAKLDLDFVNMQFHANNRESLSLLVKYNATAYQVNRTGQYLNFMERSDITHSLIHQSQILPSVTAIKKMDFEWKYIYEDVSNVSLVHIGIPSVRLNQKFPVRIAVNMSSKTKEFRLGFQFGPSIRFVRPRPSRLWNAKVTPNQYGITVRFRSKKLDTLLKSGGQISDKNLMNVAELIMEYIVEENHSPGSGYNFLSVNNNDAIGVSSGSGSTISMNHFKSDRLDTNDLHGLDSEIFLEGSSDDLDLDFTENAENTNIVNNRNSNNNNADDDKNSYSSLTNQPFIQVKLIHFMRQSNSSKIIPQSSANNLINLDVPSLLMQPNNMHIFVQFEPRDIIEPPWFPAVSTPEPRKLRILGLIPWPKETPLDGDKFYSFPFSTPPIGKIVDLTRSVFCRPSTSIGLGDSRPDVITSSSPTCSISMRQAPEEIENIGAFPNDGFLRDLKLNILNKAAGGLGMRFGWVDQLVLALPSSVEQNYHIPIAPSIYGSISLDAFWPWRDWRGPTVRRWMLEGFQIHATRTVLRKIVSWKIPHTSASSINYGAPSRVTENESIHGLDRYEQTLITVTARIYTMKPGTGQRIYLGSSFSDKQYSSSAYSMPPHFNQFHAHEDGSSEMRFDITRLLPLWSLVVKSVRSSHPSSEINEEAGGGGAAYLHRDAFSGRPYLIGRFPGKVELNLVATLGDIQPLSTLSIEVVDLRSPQDQPKSVYADNPDIVALKAECVDPHLELSGNLIPAAASNNHIYNSQDIYDKVRSHLPADEPPITRIQDKSLPNPHRLNINLIGRSPNVVNLVTAAASSTIRHPQSFKFKVIQKDQNPVRIMDTMGPLVSSAVCPIHLLVINLILSDGSTISAHTIPKNQIRISSYGTQYVWDPAVPIRPNTEDGEQRVNITVPINSLIIWPAKITDKGDTTHHALPLAIMDDVFVYIRKSGMVQDPGNPQNPAIWFTSAKNDKISEKILHPDNHGKDSSAVSSSAGSWLQFSTLLTLSNADNSMKSNNHKNQYSQAVPLVTYMLVSVGCLALILLMITCSVILFLRKKHLSHPKTENKSQFNLLSNYEGRFNERSNHFDSDEQNYIEDKIISGRLTASHMTSSTGEQSKQLNVTPTYCNKNSGQALIVGGSGASSSPHCIEGRTQLVSGRSCSSMGSMNSGTFINTNIKHSMIVDTTVNPYFICSESSSSGRLQHASQHSCSTNLSPINTPGLISYQTDYNNSVPQGNWNTPTTNLLVHPNHQRQSSYSNTGNTDKCLLWPMGHHVGGQPCNGDYTSGLGSVGTAEGCSDEGVASGIEVNSLSQELNNNTSGGITHFPGSMRCKFSSNTHSQRHTPNGYCSAHESLGGRINSNGNNVSINHSRDASIKCKHTMTSTTIDDNNGVCVGGGSLSGTSSGADISEYRQTRGQFDSRCQTKNKLNSQPSNTGYIVSSQTDGGIDSNCSQRLTNVSKISDFIGERSPKSNCKINQMFESFIHDSPQITFTADAGDDFQRKMLSGENNIVANTMCTNAKDSMINKSKSTYGSNNQNLHSTVNPIGEDYDGFAVHVPPMMLLNNRINSTTLTKPLTNSPLLLNRPYDIDEYNSYERKQTSLGYKRSDSFGMATHRIQSDQEGCMQNDDLAQKITFNSDYCSLSNNDKQSIFLQDSMVGGAIDEMIGDSSDVTDDVGFPQKLNDKIIEKSENHSNRSNSDGLSYLHNIPPPEV